MLDIVIASGAKRLDAGCKMLSLGAKRRTKMMLTLPLPSLRAKRSNLERQPEGEACCRLLSSFVFTVQYFNFVMHKPDAATA
jgi:hypothetical protein